MRITIGGILLVGGVVTVAAVVGPFGQTAGLFKPAIGGVTNLIKSYTQPSVAAAPEPILSESVPVDPVPETTGATTGTVESAADPLSPVSLPTAEPVAAPSSATTPAEPVVEPPKPAVVKAATPRRRTRVRRNRHRAPAAPASKDAAKAAPPKAAASKATGSSDALIGQYVAVKLKSGREVKGVLLVRTTDNITLEIPGMGPFQYPSSNIDGIAAAE